MIEVNWNPDRRMLRQFGLIGLAVFAAMAAWGAWRHGPTTSTVVLGALAAGFGLLALAVPAALKWVFIGMSVVSAPIGFVVSHVILGIIYFLLFTPVALVFKLVGRDSMCRRFDRGAKTYWTERPRNVPSTSYFRQY